MGVAARMFGVDESTVVEWLRRDPEAWREILARAAEARTRRPVPATAEAAARAVHEDHLSFRDAAASYGVPEHAVHAACRKLYPGVDYRRRRWLRG